MTTLYRPVQVTNDAQREALPKGSFMHPDCYLGGILTYLVPIEAEEECTRPVQLYISAVHVAPPSSATKPSRRLVTPWEAAS